MVERGVKPEQPGDLFLPPGFRFHPTDNEIITNYLLEKFKNPVSFQPRAIGEVNLNKCEPWDLPSKARMGEKEWYFFCHKDMKYPTGMRTNRATKEGYWKATGKDREIFNNTASSASAGDGGRELVGMKKTLVFYMGRAPRGSKTNWVMHEFRLEGKYRDSNANLRPPSRKDEWVVCKVFHKNNGEDTSKKAAMPHEYDSAATPNVSSISVDGTGGDDAAGDDFLDSIIDRSSYFIPTPGGISLPEPDDMNNTVAPYNAVSCLNLPNYDGFTFSDTANRNNLLQAAATNSTVPTSSSYSSSWNLLHAAGPPIPMVASYNLHDQATMMAKTLGAVASPNFTGGLPSSSLTGISQQNSLVTRNYGGRYLTGDAKNQGA